MPIDDIAYLGVKTVKWWCYFNALLIVFTMFLCFLSLNLLCKI